MKHSISLIAFLLALVFTAQAQPGIVSNQYFGVQTVSTPSTYRARFISESAFPIFIVVADMTDPGEGDGFWLYPGETEDIDFQTAFIHAKVKYVNYGGNVVYVDDDWLEVRIPYERVCSQHVIKNPLILPILIPGPLLPRWHL